MGRRQHQNQPKPGGSRRQAKLAARAAEREALTVDPRPFMGLAGECDMVAMREFVPSATARLPLVDSDREVTLATVLPGAVAALVRDESLGGEAMVGMQVQAAGTDPGAELAAAIDWARTAAPGSTMNAARPQADTPKLSELLDASAPMEVTVHRDFRWWLAGDAEPNAQVAQAIGAAEDAMMPSERVSAEGVEAAWWVDTGERAHIRWVRPEDEDALFDALARAHAAGKLHLGEGSRFAGSFRTHGVLVPVFDLDRERHHQEWAPGLEELDRVLRAELERTEPLSSAERSSRDGLRARQVTLR